MPRNDSARLGRPGASAAEQGRQSPIAAAAASHSRRIGATTGVMRRVFMMGDPFMILASIESCTDNELLGAGCHGRLARPCTQSAADKLPPAPPIIRKAGLNNDSERAFGSGLNDGR